MAVNLLLNFTIETTYYIKTKSGFNLSLVAAHYFYSVSNINYMCLCRYTLISTLLGLLLFNFLAVTSPKRSYTFSQPTHILVPGKKRVM